jgi:pimeloyl-ACP methyl ester carboxylesterase
MINWYRAYRFSKPKPAGPIAVPALIIWGKKDAFLLAEMAQKSATHCTHAQLELVDRATHWIHHEQPGLVNSLIYSFVNKEHQDAQGAVNN